MRNIELKAQLRNRNDAEAVCKQISATFQGDIHQIDTYFQVPEGRLKLREKTPGGDELIFYTRPDTPNSKSSEYDIAPASPELKRVLTDALGVLAIVDKVRGLWLWDNVRIHLDRVEGLGNFIEFEAILSEEYNDADGHAKVAKLTEDFGLQENDLIECSYLDLTRAKKETG